MRLSPSINLIVTLFTAGTMLLQFFIILAGTKDSGILRKFYWLQVDTAGLSDEPITEYSLWGYCFRNGSFDDPGSPTTCAPFKAAYAFQPDVQFGSEAPSWFSDNHHQEYWLTRLLFPWYIIALAFELPVLFLAIFSIATRWIGVSNGLLSFVAFLFQASASAMVTVAYVEAKSHFTDAGIDAKLGRSLMGFTWACVFMLAFNSIFFCCIRPSHGGHDGEKHEEGAFAPPPVAQTGHQDLAPDAVNDTQGGRFFGFRSNTVKSRVAADDSSFVRAH